MAEQNRRIKVAELDFDGIKTNLKNYDHVFLNGNLENLDEIKTQILKINSKINIH